MLLGIHRIGRGRGLIHLTIPIPGMVILRSVLQITQLIKFIIACLVHLSPIFSIFWRAWHDNAVAHYT